MNKVKLIPNIRFYGFYSEWKKTKLGDMAGKFEYGLNASATKYDGENKYIRITDIDESTHKFINSKVTSPDTDLLTADNYLLEEGDILFARTGASVGKSYQYDNRDGKLYYAGFLIRARINPSYDTNFVFQNTLTSNYEKFIKVTSQRSGQPGINAQEYMLFKIIVPNKEEQMKIGIFLKKIDNIIMLEQQLLNDHKQFKKAMLQKMFPQKGETVPRVRFAGFSDNWEEKVLKDIIQNQIKGKSQFGLLSAGEVEYLDANKLNGGPTFLSNGDKNVYKEDILILWDGSKAGTLYKGFEGTLGSTLKAYSINQDNNSEFTYQYLLNKQSIIYNNYRTPNIPHVVKDFSEIFPIIIPSLKEQEKIGNFFKQLDETIALHENKLETYQELKKAMLQKMFV